MRPPRPLPRGTEPPSLPPGTPLTAPPATPFDPSAVPEGWEGIMVPGERIVWRGRPIRRIRWLKLGIMVAFGAFFAGFSLFWMRMATQAGGYFWMFGLIHFSVGLGIIAAAVLDERMRLSSTFYTLSDRAAYIARRHWWKGRQIETWPITADMPLSLGGGDKAGDVIFATRIRPGHDAGAESIGFLDITGAPEVFALMRSAREAQR